jgi:hypothetical protein
MATADGASSEPVHDLDDSFINPPVMAQAQRLINAFVNHFIASQDETVIAFLDPILGDPGSRNRLDKSLRLGLAVERRFRQSLKAADVVSTKNRQEHFGSTSFFLDVRH